MATMMPSNRMCPMILLLATVSAFAGEKTLPCMTTSAEDYSSCLERRGSGLVVRRSVLRHLSFIDGLSSVWSKGLGWMYLNKTGKIIIEGVSAMDNGPDDFHDGLVRVERNGKCGFSNREGKAAIPLIYDGCLNFENKAARVCLKCHSECDDKECGHHEFKGGEWICINTSGDRLTCAP
jgi:hypothetical protein